MKRKKLILGFTIAITIALSAFVSSVSAAPGDLLWVKTSNPSALWDEANGVAVDSTGVYIVGSDLALGQSNGRWRIEKRSRTTGSLIWPKTSNPTTGNDVPYGVAVDSTGVYIGGHASVRWRLEKRNQTTGSLKWGNSIGYPGSIYGVAVDSTGVYIVGSDETLGYSARRWRVEKRSKTTGSLIWSKTSSAPEARRVAVDSTGVYIVGSEAGGLKWRIEKRDKTTGSLIWFRNSDPSTGYDEAYDVAVDSTGVYVVGYDSSLYSGASNMQWRIEKRDKTTGSLIWAKTSNPTNYPDIAWCVAVSSTGVYIVGYQNVGWGDKQWRIEKRSLATGSLIWFKTSNPSTGYDWPWDVAVDSTGVYIVGYQTVGIWGNRQWRIEKRAP